MNRRWITRERKINGMMNNRIIKTVTNHRARVENPGITWIPDDEVL